MVSAALQPNLANVSTAFILCSALYILMALLVLFLVQDFHRSSGPEVATGANVNIVLAIAPTITSRIQRLEAFWHTQSQADNSINHQRAKKNHEDWPHWHRTALVDLENSQNPSSSQVSLKRLAPFAWKPMRLPRTRPSVPRRRQRSRYRRRYCHPSGIRRHRDEEVGAP